MPEAWRGTEEEAPEALEVLEETITRVIVRSTFQNLKTLVQAEEAQQASPAETKGMVQATVKQQEG